MARRQGKDCDQHCWHQDEIYDPASGVTGVYVDSCRICCWCGLRQVLTKVPDPAHGPHGRMFCNKWGPRPTA